MMKRLFILLVVILIFIAAVVFTPIAAVLPWFVTRSDPSITSVDASSPIMTVISTLPANPTSPPTPVNELMSPSPICFVPEELLPFAFTPEATKIFVRARSGVQVFNLKSGAQEAYIHSYQDVITAALSPDGQVLAWSLDDNTIQLLRISDQKVLHTLSGHTDMVTKLRFSTDGDLLVSASHDHSVRVWNTQGEELRSLQAGDVLGIAISPDGSMLATVPFDGPVALWDLDTLEKIKDLGGSGGYDTSDAEFSPDGQYLVADLATGIYMWRISDGSLVWNPVKNSMAVTFSPDGQYLAYSDVDDGNNVILASPDAAQIVRIIGAMQGPVWELFFSPNGSLLAATEGREIHVWRVTDGTLLYIAKAACP
jgi:WD40 repeat protein